VEWWKKSVVYQVYPLSFADSNGDGRGDLRGVIAKLPYLAELGIDTVWLSPVYRSPMVDNGYDISDYYDIDPLFGSMSDMDRLIQRAKSEYGIGIVMDLVVNHTSDQHVWFSESRSSKTSSKRDFYVWRDPAADGGPPNDMGAVFGGSAWNFDPQTEQYYLGFFSPGQPDLNWKNPELRSAVYRMMNWWLDRGLRGFRMDVIELIGKEPDEKIMENGPRLHDYIREMNRECLAGRDTMTVGEAWNATLEEGRKFSRADGSELSMIFNFEHIRCSFEGGANRWIPREVPLPELKAIIARWQEGLYRQGWNSLFTGNHDLPRFLSRWGDESDYRVESAKMIATTFHGLQGTPFVYQGEEIGMTNPGWNDIEKYRDLDTLNYYREQRERGVAHEELMRRVKFGSRDNARTPMQWEPSVHAGFSTVRPWIDLNENYLEVNATAAVADPNSIYHYYRRLCELRRSVPLLVDGRFELLLPEHPSVFCFLRVGAQGRFLVVCSNFTAQNIVLKPDELPSLAGSVLIHNYDRLQLEEGSLTLRPYESFLLAARTDS
jgi:glycosidase